eukprot:385842_1
MKTESKEAIVRKASKTCYQQSVRDMLIEDKTSNRNEENRDIITIPKKAGIITFDGADKEDKTKKKEEAAILTDKAGMETDIMANKSGIDIDNKKKDDGKNEMNENLEENKKKKIMSQIIVDMAEPSIENKDADNEDDEVINNEANKAGILAEAVTEKQFIFVRIHDDNYRDQAEYFVLSIAPKE